MSNQDPTKPSTAQSFRPLGAVPVKNEKGEITMQKVKVNRYVSGRKPKYADSASSESEQSDDELDIKDRKILPPLSRNFPGSMSVTMSSNIVRAMNVDDEEPEELEKDEDGDMIRHVRRYREVIDAEEEDEEDEDDENIVRHHEALKQRLESIELSAKDEGFYYNEEEEDDDNDEEESEYESEYSEDEAMPRLKPIFVPKKDRITIIENEEQEKKRAEAAELEAKIAFEERRRSTLKMIEEDRRLEEEEREKNKAAAEEEAIIKGIASVVTDDEDEETAFELWKVRELRRIKREKEEEEERERERREVERLRNMTEEERQEELAKNPRLVTNQQKKGKYKYLQKYYHRGAFYLDVEDEVFKRDFAQPTLEDHFDKSVLPSVMQVKNFGRAGRTKYTHLTDVDTTVFDSPWSAKDNVHAIQFHQTHGGGMKQSFERPGKRKK